MVPVVDAILSLVLVEAAALALYHRISGRGVAPHNYGANLAAGFSLLLTARLAMSEAPSWAILATLSASLCAHLLDLRTRWIGRGQKESGPK